jgi:hypothetical protein
MCEQADIPIPRKATCRIRIEELVYLGEVNLPGFWRAGHVPQAGEITIIPQPQLFVKQKLRKS